MVLELLRLVDVLRLASCLVVLVYDRFEVVPLVIVVGMESVVVLRIVVLELSVAATKHKVYAS